jgi:hypothetical protein
LGKHLLKEKLTALVYFFRFGDRPTTAAMGKKKKSKKKLLGKLMKSNKVLLAALSGTAAGIAIANIMGTGKAKELVDTVENSIRDFKDKVKNDQPSVHHRGKAELKHSAG